MDRRWAEVATPRRRSSRRKPQKIIACDSDVRDVSHCRLPWGDADSASSWLRMGAPITPEKEFIGSVQRDRGSPGGQELVSSSFCNRRWLAIAQPRTSTAPQPTLRLLHSPETSNPVADRQ
jgi:hypothetical protein